MDLIDALTQYGLEKKLKDVQVCHLHTEVRVLHHAIHALDQVSVPGMGRRHTISSSSIIIITS